ncbi:unnamed protein product [Discula destructiva]
MANAGPLTTTFTAPPSCTTATGLYQIWAANTYHFEQGPLASMTSCFPSGYDAAVTSQYFSPGICPSGYITACSSTDVLSATVTETAYTCCPRGRVLYTCAASAADTFNLGCTTVFGGNIGIDYLTAISNGIIYSTAVTATAGQGIGAHSIAVRVRNGDSTTSELALATATSTNWSGPIPISSASASSGLSTAGIAGISAGVGALVLAILGSLGFFLWMRRRKQRALSIVAPQQHSPPPTYSQRGPPPPRPPRPFAPPPLGPRAPPPAPPLPPKQTAYSTISKMPMSPSPSTTSSDFKKAREVEFYQVRNVEIRKKPRPLLHDDVLDGSKRKKSSARDTNSSFSTLVNGPFELPGECAGGEGEGEEEEEEEEEEKKQWKAHQQMYEMHELYGAGGEQEWATTGAKSPRRGGGAGRHLLSSSSKSFETLQSAELMGSYPTTSPRQKHGFPMPPGYGAQQPAELEEAPLARPARSFHRRTPSERWGRGTSDSPAELPTGQDGFL